MGGGKYVGDTKVFDPNGSDPAATPTRGGYVAFGGTLPAARELVHGRAERGVPGTAFDPRTGGGHVGRVEGQYDRAEGHGVEVQALLFEVWGGWSPAVVDLVKRAEEAHSNKLRRHEYDEATWSTRTWPVFAAQRVGCALTRAVAEAIARELGLTTARDPRGE